MTATEEMRLLCLREREDEARKQGYQLIAGIDEAGRGPLAGPVVSAACILPEGFILNGVNDSKKLTPGLRDSLYLQLVENPTIHFAIGIADHDLIDEINIYQATIHSMQQAIDKLPVVPDFLLVDGLKLPSDSIPNEKVIKGDATVLAIAAASILAKVTLILKQAQQHAMQDVRLDFLRLQISSLKLLLLLIVLDSLKTTR